MRADRGLPAALLVLGAVAAVLLHAPTAVATALSLVATAAVAQRLAGARGRGPADAVLVGVGGVLAVLVLTGLALDLAGVPLAPARPGAGARRAGPGRRARPAAGPRDGAGARPAAADLRHVPWAVACAAVATVAITASVRSADSVDVARSR